MTSRKPLFCPIREMDQLIDHLSSFENLINKAQDFSDPNLIKEYRLFRQYIKYRTRDFNLASLKELNQVSHIHMK